MTQKMHFSEYIFKTFLKELVIFLDIISVCSVSKTAASSQGFFCHILGTVPKKFRSFSKFFQSISTTHSVPFRLMCFVDDADADADF